MGIVGIHHTAEMRVVPTPVTAEPSRVQPQPIGLPRNGSSRAQPIGLPRNGSSRPPGLGNTLGSRPAIKIRWNSLIRKTHCWGSIAIALPLIVVIASGILLQVKKEVHWVQPTEQRGQAKHPQVTFERILKIVKGVPLAEVRSWSDIKRVDVRPSRGMAKVTAANRWEVQLDTKTGAVLQVAYRRSDLISDLHDGSWFHEAAKLWVFLPSALVLLGLLLTGLYLFALPLWAKSRRARTEGRHASANAMANAPFFLPTMLPDKRPLG